MLETWNSYEKSLNCSTCSDIRSALQESTSKTHRGLPKRLRSVPLLEDSDHPNHPSSPCSRTSACSTERTSPSQTLIFFDWDDTLFPTTELFQRWQVPKSPSAKDVPDISSRQETALQKWRDALHAYLQQACSLSDHVTIVTASKPGWVQYCIDKFVPQIKPLFEAEGGPVIIYASEAVDKDTFSELQSTNSRPLRYRKALVTAEEFDSEQTMQKLSAMIAALAEVHFKCPGHYWQNLLSIGDMPYERDALQELAFRHCGECSWSKTLLVPSEPALSEITLRLQFSRLMLPKYVHFDGNFEIDLQAAEDPIFTIAKTLKMPKLAEIKFSRHAWGRSVTPDEKESISALKELQCTLSDLLTARRARELGVRWLDVDMLDKEFESDGEPDAE
eukprot:TRINITY_DN30819_c0_g2_i1.p1 TRINITY_DN30819_c0_g2~~TRINITY_DN30819_c0_g2_i1.p1  ORF type:complete len:390 (+),score=58.48 TRINITY_DN30819_c0_g2_i1:38-1207(+)